MIKDRGQLLSSLRGQSVKVPDLHTLLPGFPQDTSPDIDRLRVDIDAWLDSLFPAGPRLNALKGADMAMFGSTWWPYAPYLRLRTATYLATWLFAWDDETDSQEFSSLQGDFDQTQSFRDATLEYIHHTLHLTDEPMRAVPKNPLVYAFRDVAEDLVAVYTVDQRRAFYEHLEFYLHMTEVEQRAQLGASLPSVSEYSRFRMGTSAVGACLALTEYGYDMRLPSDVMRDPDMQRVWDESNIIVSTVNDILSIKKELALGQLVTLVPLLCAERGDLQAAVDAAVEMLRVAAASLDSAAKTLAMRYAGDAATAESLERFVRGCRYSCTATLDWSLLSRRYHLGCTGLYNGVTIEIPAN